MSVTFRDRGIDEVACITALAGLQSIGWSGDVHVPVGCLVAADAARAACADGGLTVESYASYWRADGSDPLPHLQTAARLGTTRMRVWAGVEGSAEASDHRRAGTAAAIANAADAGADLGIELCLEFHRNTLTDTAESALRLLAEVHELRRRTAPELVAYWQPRPGTSVAAALHEVALLAPALVGFHVSARTASGDYLGLDRPGPFALWNAVLKQSRASRHVDVMMEFVADDSVQQLNDDCAVLRSMLDTPDTSRASRGQSASTPSSRS